MSINRYINFIRENLSDTPTIGELKEYLLPLTDLSIDNRCRIWCIHNNTGHIAIINLDIMYSTSVESELKHISENIRLDYPELTILYCKKPNHESKIAIKVYITKYPNSIPQHRKQHLNVI